MRSIIGKTFSLFVIASVIFVSSSPAFAANVLRSGTAETSPEVRYNEVFDEKGQVRPHYRLILPAWAGRVHHMQDYERSTFQEFKRGKLDSNAINDIPRMITKKEYAEVTRGVHQRERAIQAFLHDHYSGQKAYAKQGIISEAVVDAIILRSGEDGYQGLIDGSTPMNFLYGPDLIRGPDGILRALEDNIGFVGGFGDIVLAQRISERLYPEIAQHYQYPKATEFFDELVQVYREQAKKFGGKIVMYGDANITDDSEDQRTLELFDELGIEVLTPTSKRRMEFTKNGVYVQDKNGDNREKVGFIVLNLEHADGDLFHPATFEKAILDNAANFVADKDDPPSKKKRAKVLDALMSYNPRKGNKLKQLTKIQDLLSDSGWRVNPKEGSRRLVGIVDAILKGRVGSSYSPGAEFVGDKQMYTHIEDFIRFYLHEEPIIRNVETYMFNQAGTSKVSEDILDKVFGKNRLGENIGDWVLKPVDGRGGDGIVFGKEVKPQDIPALIEKVKENPGRLQAQRNTPPSLMPGNRIIDTRPLTYSTDERAVVTPVPWSRSATVDKSRLINVSSGGAVNAVFVIGNRKANVKRTCESIFGVAN